MSANPISRVDRIAIGDDLDQALSDEQHAERLDEGGNLELDDDKPVDQPDSAAGNHTADKRKRHGQSKRGHQLGAANGRQPGDGANRQVELAANQQYRLTDRDNTDERDNPEDGAYVANREEGRFNHIKKCDD
jgi:hypothetical protein